MREDRVVEVWAWRGGDRYGPGSGYRITSDLVLTAAHVIVAEDPTPQRPYYDIATSTDIRIRRRSSPELYTGVVVWRGADANLDLALVRVDDAAWRDEQLAPVRWGRTTCQSPGVACAATGFPEVTVLPDERREREQLSGHLSPTSGEKESQYHVQVSNAPVSPAVGDSAWCGMSGAALFSADVLIGVIVIDHKGFDGSRLLAVRVSAAFEDPEFLSFVAAGGSCGDLFRARDAEDGVPALESAELTTLFAAPRTSRRPRSPATLLTAHTSAVRWFHRREPKIVELLDWLGSPEPVDVRLVVGPGGHGKTRLARELVHRAVRAGWIAGLVKAQSPAELDPDVLARLTSCEVPLLLVVDYAETRPDVVRVLLERIKDDEPPPVRLLLLARSPGQWWQSLWSSCELLQELLALDDIEVVDQLPDDTEQRSEAFSQALADLSDALPSVRNMGSAHWTAADWKEVAAQVDVPNLSGHRYRSILHVHLAALVGLLRRRPTTESSEAASHEEYLLLRERHYWSRSAAESGLQLNEQTLTNAVTVATLLGADTVEEALACLSRVHGLQDQSDDRLMTVDHWLQTLYPASGGGLWGALEPDRLGEYLVAEQLARHPALLNSALAAASGPQLHRALHVLARAGAEHPAAVSLLRDQVLGQPARLVPAALAVCVETEEPAALLAAVQDALEQAADHADVLSAIVEEFPAVPSELVEVGEQITRMEAEVYSRLVHAGQRTYLPRLARAHQKRSEQLFQLGRLDEARREAAEATQAFRELAAPGSGGEGEA
ncbi:trypsin-like peptidase domain-containing protein [Streptomyces bobili]|uniref:trypsin-like peptidase domain-containing protein n=1 Tax=Streptomyces bobili TaxID=67280 RepID=UPI0037B63B41